MSKPIFTRVSEFKTQNNIDSMEVLRRNVDGVQTTFVTTDTGKTFAAQKDLNLSAPLVFIREEGESVDKSTLINYDASKGATSLGSL